MSTENASAICTATASGMPDSSVAANSELRIVPLPSLTVVASGAVSTLVFNSPLARLTDRRSK